MAAASTSISSTFITDAIADFKGRLDTLMEESLSKYREKAIADISDDYTPGYGEITDLVIGTSTSSGFSLPTIVPTKKFGKEKGMWIIHSCKYMSMYYDSGSFGYGSGGYRSNGYQAFAFDNYGNVYNYQVNNGSYCPFPTPVIGTGNYCYPLTNSMITEIKKIPASLENSSDGTASLFLNSIIPNLAKLAAETIYKSRQAVLQLRKELDAERAKTAALDAELRALKDRSPPSEDLLGLTEEGPKAASGPLASAIMEL